MTPDDVRFCQRLRDALLSAREIQPDVPSVLHVYPATSFPKTLWGFALTLSQPALDDLTVVRAGESVPTENVRKTLNATVRHQRFRRFSIADPRMCSIAVDFIAEQPTPIELGKAFGGRGLAIGADGLRLVAGRQRCYVLPTQWSGLGLDSPKGLGEFLVTRFPDVHVQQIQAFVFQPHTYVFTARGWGPFRRHPTTETTGQVVSTGEWPRGTSTASHEESTTGTGGNPKVDWQRIKQLAAAQLPDGRFADPPFDLKSHCDSLASMLRYCREAEDLSIIPQITLGLTYLVESIGPGEPSGKSRSSEARLSDATTRHAEVQLLLDYEARTGDAQYHLIVQRLRVE